MQPDAGVAAKTGVGVAAHRLGAGTRVAGYSRRTSPHLVIQRGQCFLGCATLLDIGSEVFGGENAF